MLTGGDVQVRPAVLADAADIAEVYLPFVTGTAVSFEEEPPDAGEVARRMQLPPGLPWLVAVDGHGDLVGYAYATPHRARPAYRWSVDCSVYVAQGRHGRGTGRALYAALLPLLGELGLARAHAGITLPNDASVALHTACGFRPVGVYPQVGHKLGRWHDVGWWQRPLDAATQPPVEPRRWVLPG